MLRVQEKDWKQISQQTFHIRVENPFIKTVYSNWKHARNTDKGFHQNESSNCHKQAIQRLIEIPKSTEDVFEMIN